MIFRPLPLSFNVVNSFFDGFCPGLGKSALFQGRAQQKVNKNENTPGVVGGGGWWWVVVCRPGLERSRSNQQRHKIDRLFLLLFRFPFVNHATVHATVQRLLRVEEYKQVRAGRNASALLGFRIMLCPSVRQATGDSCLCEHFATTKGDGCSYQYSADDFDDGVEDAENV